MHRSHSHPHSPTLSLVLLCAVWLGSSAALADDIKVAISNQTVQAGKGNPTVEVKVLKAIKRISIDLRDGKGRHRASKGPVKAGDTVKFPLPHTSPGKRTWQGELSVVFQDKTSGSMPLQFQTTVATLFTFDVVNSQEDIQNEHRVTIKMERPCSKLEVEAYGERGVLIASTGKEMDNAPAGTPMTVDWVPGHDGPVLRVHVTAYDDTGMHRSADFFPYLIDVPHEEVVFETGKWDIRPSEEEKLVAALGNAKDAVERYLPAVKAANKTIRLWVIGHTDTVGSPGSNLALSKNRARAIAQWFKAHGIGVQIYFRGYGESMPKVNTPDETDEERNRRVDYQVGVNSPSGSTSGWTPL